MNSMVGGALLRAFETENRGSGSSPLDWGAICAKMNMDTSILTKFTANLIS